MTKRKLLMQSSVAIGLLIAGCMSAAAQPTAPVAGRINLRNTPTFAATAKSIGVVDQSEMIEVSIWLNLRNKSDLDSLAKEVYNPATPRFRQWLSRAEFAAKYAPTAEEAKKVQQFFVSHNLSVVSVDKDNMFVRARGTVGDVARAFRVSINKFEVNGKVYRANTSDPVFNSDIAPLVRSVAGLDNIEFKTHLVRPIIKGAKTKPGMTANAEGSADSDFFTSTCFTGSKTETYGAPGTYPSAYYKGNSYGGDPDSPGCGYTPPEIRKAYNLNGLYAKGYDGTGQSIVIIDWCGSPSIMQDANAFSARFGLPPITSSNFSIVEYPRRSTCAVASPEINLDVEWAHAIAPGANIVLLVPPSATFVDIDEAQYHAEISGLGNVISGSYGAEELLLSLTELENQTLINEIGALFGIGVNFSTGDSGDFTFDFPQFNPASVSAPADSPFATAVGGVALALNPDRSIKFQTGWGNNATQLRAGGVINDPPANFGFQGGSGGGPSGVWAKPSYQSKLPGNARQLPDVSWLADPFTGGVILISLPGVFPPQQYQVYGGTSLACPMFAALWAIANQEAGAPLGLAAPYLYSMPKDTIIDILPYSSASNVFGIVKSAPKTSTLYTPADLAAPLEGTTSFYSAIWDYPALFAFETNYVLTFGTDSGLHTTKGWDNVTGVGVPNGEAFADYFKGR